MQITILFKFEIVKMTQYAVYNVYILVKTFPLPSNRTTLNNTHHRERQWLYNSNTITSRKIKIITHQNSWLKLYFHTANKNIAKNHFSQLQYFDLQTSKSIKTNHSVKLITDYVTHILVNHINQNIVSAWYVNYC